MLICEAKQILNENGYYLIEDEYLNEARKPKIKLIFGIRKRTPGAKCKPAFATFEEADEYMDKLTYPQDFEIVNLIQHPELLEESYQVAWDDKVRYEELPTETNNTSLMQYEKDIKNFCFKNKINYDGFLSCKDSPFDTLIVKYYEHDIPVDAICRSIMHWISTKHPELINEDFTQGVGAPLGADQGIPHSMQGCAVPMMRLGEPAPYGKIQKPCLGHRPHQRHRPIGFFPVGMLMTPIVVRKKKKKKKKNKRAEN